MNLFSNAHGSTQGAEAIVRRNGRRHRDYLRRLEKSLNGRLTSRQWISVALLSSNFFGSMANVSRMRKHFALTLLRKLKDFLGDDFCRESGAIN
jgi:hypothetical protein